MKRLLCGLLVLCTLFSLVPMPAYATETEQPLVTEAYEEVIEETTEATTEATEPATEEVEEPAVESDIVDVVNPTIPVTPSDPVAPTDPVTPTDPTDPTEGDRPDPVKPILTAKTDASTGKPYLVWPEDKGAVEFQVYRATSKKGKFKCIDTVSEYEFIDDSASVNKTYYYKVRAVAEDGSKTSYSSVKSAFTKLAAPDVSVAMVASSGKIKVKWGKVSGAKEYQVYRAVGANGSWKKVKTTTSSSYTDSSVKPGNGYYYKVKAIYKKSAANSAYSEVVNQLCLLATPQVTLSNDIYTGKIKLTWPEVNGAEQYIIFRAPAGSEEFVEYAALPEGNFVDEAPLLGEAFSYQVQAMYHLESASSEVSSVFTGICKLGAPTITVAENVSGKIHLTWEAVPEAVSYSVYRATSAKGTYKKLREDVQLEYIDTNVSVGKEYFYQVVANAADSAVSSERTEVLTLRNKLAAPVLKSTASVTKSSIKISWKKVSGASGYYVYRRSVGATSWKKLKTVSSSTTSYTDKTAKGKYEYSVAAYKTISKKKYTGNLCDPVIMRTLSAPSSVIIPDSDISWQNTVTWKAVSGATGYQVYYKTSSKKSEWALLGTVTDELEYVHSDVQHGVYIYYKVRPIFEDGGVTCTGPFKEGNTGWMWYHNPNKVSVSMPYSTDRSTSVTVIYVTNNGPDKIRFYSSGGRWLDKDYYSYDRDIVLYDYEAYEKGKLKKTSYVDIPAGSSGWLLVGVKGNKTWYDKYTQIKLKAYHCGQYFWTYSSYYWGFRYSKI